MTTGMRVQDKYLTLNRLRFHYRDWGEPGAPPIVLLHGLSSHAHRWDGFAASIQDRYRLLALDQRGHGETEWADDYALDRWVEDVEAFVRALALPPAVLIGHSMGAWIAEFYAARQPDTVRRLVIVDQAPRDPVAAPPVPLQLQDAFEDFEAITAFRRQFFPYTSEELLREYSRHTSRQLDDGRWTYRFDPKLRTFTGPSGHDAERNWEAVRAIACPTLLMVGAESQLNQIGRANVERMVREMPDCRLVEVPASAHNVPFDNPDAFLAAVQGFLAAG